MAKHASCLAPLIRHQQALFEVTISIRTPIGLLGVIGLQHVRPLHIHGDDEVRARIRIRLTRLSKLDVARHVG